MKTVIGAGILSLPFTFSRLGWLLSIFTIILVLGLVHLTCVFLLNSKNISRHNNYTTIGDSIFQSENGKFAMRIVSSMIIIGANIGVGIV